MKILTISIAAYNVENYLAQTLQSIVDSKVLEQIEVLVIDDGSKDKTAVVAKRFEESYPGSIKYIAKENGGHGSTINKGIELATGKYFRVLDGDDYVDSDGFREYVNKLMSTDADLIISNFRTVNLKGEVKIDPAVLENGQDPFEKLRENVLLDFPDSISSTRVLGLSTVAIKTNLLQNNSVYITEKCFYVDVEFILWCIHLAGTYVYWNIPVYMYRKDDNGNNSVSKKNMIKNIAMQEKVSYKLCELYQQFKKTDKKEKLDLAIDRTAISVGATIRTYMLFNDTKESKNHIMQFDKEILKRTPETYEALNVSKFIRFVRLGNYIFLNPIRTAYRIYIARR